MIRPPSAVDARADPPAAFRVAAVQFEPAMHAKEANLRALLRLTEEAAAAGARLIVLPEMATTAYCWGSREEVAPYVEPIPGPTTEQFGQIAARFNCYLVVGLPELTPATGVYYNSAALVGPDGLIGVYRKTHSYVSEPKWAKDGDLGLPVFATPLGRIAIVICMDASYPETTRVPALNGADVICFPTNWLSEKSPSPTWMARAAESGVFFIAANRHGLERGVQFSGGSAIIDPDGGVQAWRDAGDGVVYGEVDPVRARDKRLAANRTEDKLAGRRPDAYANLTLHSHLWNPRDSHDLYGLHPLPAGRTSRVLAVQMTPDEGAPDANLDRIAAIAAEHPGVDVLVFPELIVTGRVGDDGMAGRFAEPLPGSSTERLRAIAARHDTFVVAGLVERDERRLYNSAIVVGPEGIVGVYRKLHLTEEDRRWATPGDLGLPTFDLPVGRIGLLIGYDAVFPEAARSLAIAGADLIACPSLIDWPPVRPFGPTAIPFPSYVEAGPTDDHFHLWRERARENNSYVAFANGAAPWMGWSGVFGPGLEGEARHEALVRGDAGGIAELVMDTTNLDTRYTTNVVRAKDLLGMRMPIWYDALQTCGAAPSPLDSEQASSSSAPTGAEAAKSGEREFVGMPS
jgi:predicted amidohydrolase